MVGLGLIAFSAGVSITEAPEKTLNLPKLAPHVFAEAFPELAGDNLQFQDDQSFTIDGTDILAWLNTMDGKDTVPDVPEVPNSACLTAILNKLPYLF